MKLGDNTHEWWEALTRKHEISDKKLANCGRIDLIHDTCHLCTRSGIDGIKAMSRGISEGKQVIKFANTSNHTYTRF